MSKLSDIFDLRKRAELGLNFLNNNVDKNREFLPYFSTMFKNDPAEARHDWPDFGDLTGRYVESFVMARKMLNIDQAGEVELSLRKLLLSYFDEGDGLSYRPKPEKPYYSTIFRRDYGDHVAEGFDQARVLWALLAWYGETGDSHIKERIEEMVAGLERVMIKREDSGYYDRTTIEPGFVVDQSANPMPHQFYFCGTQIHPLIECYNLLGLEQALELAQRLANYIAYQSDYFVQDGGWNCPGGAGFESAEMDGHTHSRCATIAGMAMVGAVTGKLELVEKMERCYRWFYKKHCSSFGWSPEFLGRFGSEAEGSETCAIMDQINCALVFGQLGYAGYYEHAERMARNQLIENQLTDTTIVRNTVERQDTELSCFHNVADMVRGGFAGWAGPNDFIGNCEHHYCLMNCCGPAGVRALYDIWNNIYSIKEGDIYLNILMDKEDDNLIIKNSQPAEGLLSVTAKIPGTIYIPDRSWLDRQSVKISVNDTDVDGEFSDGYIRIDRVSAGDNILVKYKLIDIHEDVHTNGRDYKVIWRGDTVVEIEPSGKIMPLYHGRRSV